ERADHANVLGPAARILELREGGDERELPADAAVDMLQRLEAEAGARAVQLGASEFEPLVNWPLRLSPHLAPQLTPWYASAERVDGEVRFTVGIDVGDERCARHARELARQRGREREDVGDEHVGRHLANERQRVPGGVHDGLV